MTEIGEIRVQNPAYWAVIFYFYKDKQLSISAKYFLSEN